MIMEDPDNTARPGRLATFVETCREHGLPIQLEHLGTFQGYVTTEIGELDHVVAGWSDDSLADREVRPARMLADPRWAGDLVRIGDLLQLQADRVLDPTSFSPLR